MDTWLIMFLLVVIITLNVSAFYAREHIDTVMAWITGAMTGAMLTAIVALILAHWVRP